MDLGLNGKAAIVTGGGSNIGHGAVMELASEGANVVIADIDLPQAERTAGLARERYGVNAIPIQTDVTDQTQCELAVRRTVEELGRIDILVNNAGIGPGAHGYFRDKTVEDARRAMDLNYWGTFYCCKAVIEPMIEQRWGSIVNISSKAAVVSMAHLPAYSSAKAAVVALSNCLALEFGPHGIRVNTVCPGRIMPSSAEHVGAASTKLRPRATLLGDERDRIVRSAAMGGLGHPDDLGRVVAFLASDAARFITGKTWLVDGGTVFGDEDERLAATQQVWEAPVPAGGIASA